jgi:hypothetical protein
MSPVRSKCTVDWGLKRAQSKINGAVSPSPEAIIQGGEALDPGYLGEQLRLAIESNMNMEIFGAVVAKETDYTKIIHETRAEIARGFLDAPEG